MLNQHQPYRDYRTTYTGHRGQQQLLTTLQHQSERLGYQVQLIPITTVPTST